MNASKGVHPKEHHSRSLTFWQARAFFSMAGLYLFYYFGKKNIGAATGTILAVFDFSRQRFGMILTAFTLTYAAGQFINGFLGDRYNPKWVMTIGAVGGVVANLMFGCSNSLVLLILFWGANGYFSAMGWAPGCRILCNWFPEKRWGWWIGLYNFFPYLGGALVAPIAAACISLWGWRAAFWGPPLFLLAMTGIFLWLGCGSPREAGFQVEWQDAGDAKKVRRSNMTDYWLAFRAPDMVLPYAVALGASAIRWGLINWSILFLQTSKDEGGIGLSLHEAAFLGSSMADWGGMFFAIALGVLSDRFFHSQRRQTIVLGLIGAGGALFLLTGATGYVDAPYAGHFLLGTTVFLAGGLIQGIHTPLFCLPGDILGQQQSSTGAGIMDGWMYVGAAMAGAPLGWWLDTYGLASGIRLMGIICFAFGLLAWGIRR